MRTSDTSDRTLRRSAQVFLQRIRKCRSSIRCRPTRVPHTTRRADPIPLPRPHERRSCLLDECFHRVFSLTLCTVPKLRAILVLVVVFLGVAQAQTITRQPAPVMGVAGADWLTRPERIQEENPDLI